MRRELLAAMVASLLLGGCGQDASQETQMVQPAPEPDNLASKDFGDYVVHFNAISTDQLSSEIARTYNIVRSKKRAMLNVSIVKKEVGSIGRSVPGSVSATAVNLTGQLKNLSLRQIQEGDAVYYIGDIAVANGETLIFNVDVTPMNETSRFSVRFSRQFFTDA